MPVIVALQERGERIRLLEKAVVFRIQIQEGKYIRSFARYIILIFQVNDFSGEDMTGRYKFIWNIVCVSYDILISDIFNTYSGYFISVLIGNDRFLYFRLVVV